MIPGPFIEIPDRERGVTFFLWRRRDEPAKASLWPLLTWALVVFIAGAVFGAVLSTAFAAGGPSSSPAPDSTEHELLVEGTAAIAAPAEGRSPSVGPLPTTQLPASALASEGVADGASVESTREAAVLGEEAPPPVVEMVRAAAAEFDVDVDELLELAMCESSLRAHAVGRAQEIGLFQWQPRTWESNAPRLGYTITDIVDPVAQARLTALVLREDGGWRWTCAR